MLKPRPPEDRDFDWCASAVRVIKGMVGAIITPADDGRADRERFKWRSVVCCGGVHGTTLQVEVNDDWERVTCVEGELWVEHNETDETVTVPAGRQVIATEEGLKLEALSTDDAQAFTTAYENIGVAVTSILANTQTPQTGPGKLIYGINKYAGELVAHVVWRQPDGSWHKVDWVVPGGAEGYLAIDGERVVADTLMHWAEARDGKLTWRSGLREQEVDLTEGDGEAHRITWGAPQ